MHKSEFILSIIGYYRDEYRTEFPSLAGLFFVYRGVYNNELNRCTLKQLLFVGQSDDLKQACNDPQLRSNILGKLQEGEMIFYTLAYTNEYSGDDRMQICDSLIYELRPILNDVISEYKYQPTSIIVEGNRHAFVPTRIDAPSF